MKVAVVGVAEFAVEDRSTQILVLVVTDEVNRSNDSVEKTPHNREKRGGMYVELNRSDRSRS